MSVLVIGGDRLGNIKDNLKQRGFDKINHVTGRKKGDLRKLKIPSKTDLVLVLTDYACHSISSSIKEKIKSEKVDVLFSRRSWSVMEKHIENFLLNNKKGLDKKENINSNRYCEFKSRKQKKKV